MTKTIQIQGEEFEVDTPYAEGHTLTAIEAKVLNQTRCENIRNNTAKHIKAAKDEKNEMTMEQARELVTAYARDYVFTEAAAGGSRASLTPVQKEARRIARQVLTEHLAKDGRKVKDVDKEKFATALAQWSEDEQIVKLAKKRVAEQEKASAAIAESLAID